MLLLDVAAAATGAFAAYHWFMASRIVHEVERDDGTEGPTMDGAILHKLPDGRTIEIRKTLAAQSIRNGTGALWGAATAGLVSLNLVFEILVT